MSSAGLVFGARLEINEVTPSIDVGEVGCAVFVVVGCFRVDVSFRADRVALIVHGVVDVIVFAMVCVAPTRYSFVHGVDISTPFALCPYNLHDIALEEDNIVVN